MKKLTPEDARSERECLQIIRGIVDERIMVIQERCPHENVTSLNGGKSSGYDPPGDNLCLDCGKEW